MFTTLLAGANNKNAGVNTGATIPPAQVRTFAQNLASSMDDVVSAARARAGQIGPACLTACLLAGL